MKAIHDFVILSSIKGSVSIKKCIDDEFRQQLNHIYQKIHHICQISVDMGGRDSILSNPPVDPACIGCSCVVCVEKDT